MSISLVFGPSLQLSAGISEALDAAVERLHHSCIKCTLEIFIWTLCIYCFFAMNCPVCVTCSKGDKGQ